jgi:hypothetical protein
MVDAPERPPDPASAAAAVVALRAELELLDGALDAVDRKAALVPVVVGAIGGLFIAPDATFSGLQAWTAVAAVFVGAAAAGLALVVLRTRYLTFGPNARTTADNVHIPPAYFDRAVAGSLANAIDAMSAVLNRKGRLLNWAMAIGGASILLFALVRVTGGIAL